MVRNIKSIEKTAFKLEEECGHLRPAQSINKKSVCFQSFSLCELWIDYKAAGLLTHYFPIMKLP